MVARTLTVVAEDSCLSDREMGSQNPPGELFVSSSGAINPFDCLSRREREIAALVAYGSSNKEVARHLHISPNTVSSHLRQIFAKLGLVRRAELSCLWYRAESLMAKGKPWMLSNSR
jgi:DNA-binding CsgD family transcriptional regulator